MSIRGVVLGAVCLASCLVVSGGAQAAQNIFLEIPGVPGEVVSPAPFANQIGILSMSAGYSAPCGGQISLSSVNMLKMTDRSTVKLSTAMRDHTVYPTATLRFVRSSDNQVYQVYQMTNAMVEALQTSGSSGGDDKTTESLSLTFAQLTVSYTYFDGSGKNGGTETMTFTSGSCP
ncbi:MAG TPA: type VI secretion system tube protein Hcp [Gemmatimonadales bacterium]|nr:type VI secretion system tube protein Hcp [Gemmatimonadales bacterium]